MSIDTGQHHDRTTPAPEGVAHGTAVRRALAAALVAAVVACAILTAGPASVQSETARLQPVVPARLLETRTGPNLTTTDGRFQGTGRATAGSITQLTINGRAGIPNNAVAALLNVTAVNPDAPGFLTVFPCGQPRPNSSNVNYGPGDVAPNAVLAQIGTNNQICIYTLANTDLIVDINGYVPTGGTPTATTPARLLETRTGPNLTTTDGRFQGTGRATAGSITQLTINGRAGIPNNAVAALLNVTAVNPDAPGFLTVFPCGQPRPNSSNVNYGPGDVAPNAVLAQIGTNNQICIYTLANTDLIVDINGYVPTGGTPTATTPARLLETRTGPNLTTTDGRFQGTGRATAGSITQLTINGRAGIPNNAVAALLNVTAVNPDAPGFLTVFPCGQPRPNSSNVNYGPGDVAPNAVLAQIGTNNQICIYTLANTDLIVDINGYVPTGGTPTTTGETTTTLPASTATSSTTTTSSTTSTSSTTTTSTTTTSTVPVSPDTSVAPTTTMPPASSPTSGDHAVSTISDGTQTAVRRWNPCQSIRYVVNVSLATSSQIARMNEAIAATEQATGIDMEYVGMITDGWDGDVPAGIDADVVLAFSDEATTPQHFPGDPIGVAYRDFRAWHDGSGTLWGEFYSGSVFVDRLIPDGEGDAMLSLWLHELGHLLGLDHVSTPTELMFPFQVPVYAFGPGDREGLWKVGAAQPCIPDFPF